ncbi:MAG: type II secretion system GspH family protein [Defluviitaleaceae bacterium]|nr:type II secretion system GspH family protein [Defluviitaleaceae bacterium]
MKNKTCSTGRYFRPVECKSKTAGFSYIEIVIALALLSIMMIPIMPALSQAAANHRYAVLRHQAQSQATALALEIRRMPDNASMLVDQAFGNDNRFVYRVRLVTAGGASDGMFTAGDVSELPLADQVSLQAGAGFGDLLAGGRVVVVEVFDGNGNLAGFSVGKIN